MTSIFTKTSPFSVLVVLAVSAFSGCASQEAPTPPPVPSGSGKADGTCTYSCEANHYAPGECLGGWRCDASGACLSYVGTPRAPTACPAPVTGVQQIATGLDYSCALKLDGTIACWGDDGNAGSEWTGRTHPPAGTFRQIALAEDHACGIRSDGTVACWGGNGSANSVFPPSGAFEELAANNWTTCGIRTDGTLACWGYGAGREAELGPAGARYAHLAIGMGRGTPWLLCAITTAGATYCDDGHEDLGNVLATSDALAQIAINDSDTIGNNKCGMRSDGTMTCWGSFVTNCGVRQDGSLGCWTDAHAPNGMFRAISAGAEGAAPYLCAIRNTGALACNSGSGRVAPPAGTFIQVSAGPTHACAVRDDHVAMCWGSGPGATVPANL